ncbi:hypothetical protein GCM10028820_25240 [Tessaracoccus terricola]
MTEESAAEKVVTAAPGAPAQGRRWVGVVTTLIALVLAFVVGAVVMVVSDPNVVSKFAYFFDRPTDALGAAWDKITLAFGALIRGSLGSWGAITETTAQAAPLICAGLGVGLAFRAGLFNIGGQGQAIWGAIVGAWIGFSITGLPMVLHIPLAIICAIISGAIWGGIAGFLKARTGAHEVISTIMLNHIASGLLGYLLITRWFQMPGRTDPISPQIEWTATLPRLAGTRLHLGFLLALLAAFAVWWLLERTTLGFQIRAIGHNPHAAETAGMSVGRVTMVAMAFAGGLAGLAGAQMVMAPTLLTSFPPQLSAGIVGGVGFDAITVALLGRSRPLGIVAAGLLFGAMKAGGLTMSAEAQTPSELTSLIQALIVLFVAAPKFVTWLVPALRERRPANAARSDKSKKEVSA